MVNLILFDDSCPFCNKWIRFILEHDQKKQFLFSSLTGKTAAQLNDLLQNHNIDSVVLIKDYQTMKAQAVYQSRAIFEICWILGGIWKVIGWKKILPPVCFDWLYRIVAKNRKSLCKNIDPHKMSLYKERFLP